MVGASLSQGDSFLELVSGEGLSGRQGEPMARHSCFRVGGPAEYWMVAETEDGLSSALSWAREFGVKVRLHIGDSHLVRDNGVLGLSIALGGLAWGVSKLGNMIDVGGGYPAAALAEWALREQVPPFEFLSGTAGTVSEAVRRGLFGERVAGLRVLRGQQIRDISSEQLRDSHVILRVRLAVEVVVHGQMTLLPPVDLSSSGPGQAFKDLPKQQVSDLIREAGLCGVRLRGAAIGAVEPNTILNLGEANSSDILLLLRMMRDRMKVQLGVEVSPLIKAFGER